MGGTGAPAAATEVDGVDAPPTAAARAWTPLAPSPSGSACGDPARLLPLRPPGPCEDAEEPLLTLGASSTGAGAGARASPPPASLLADTDAAARLARVVGLGAVAAAVSGTLGSASDLPRRARAVVAGGLAAGEGGGEGGVAAPPAPCRGRGSAKGSARRRLDRTRPGVFAAVAGGSEDALLAL